ncbi:hypothetical protein [Prosthecomicrobium sp. N25]|uniref:hypothetical protein n=1 Tax=Prosthecomicrobium sp. N25 TaxID=3129254 RepID=UPI00307837D2
MPKRAFLALLSLAVALAGTAPSRAQAPIQEQAEPADSGGPMRPPAERRSEPPRPSDSGEEPPARRDTAAATDDPRDVRDWVTYRNPRYGFRFEYPADFFVSDVVLPDDAGETFRGGDGSSRLATFALPNPQGLSLARVAANYLREAGDPVVTYRRRTRNGHLVISGNRGPDVFYLRIAYGRGGVQGVELSYPGERERAFDRLVSRVSLSFRPGR